MNGEIIQNATWHTTEFFQSVALICERYNIGQALHEPRKLSGGSLHEMWLLTTTTGNYALKRVNVTNCTLLKNTLLPINLAENLALHHQQHGLLTRVALRSSTHNLLERCHHGQSWMLFPWIEGEMRKPSAITYTNAQIVGQLLSKIQASAPKLTGLQLPHWFGFSEAHWENLIQKAEQQLLPWATTARENQKILNDWSNAAAKVAAVLQKNLITSHRDLSFSNIIWRPDDRPVVIDWEYSGLVNPELERFNTAMTWSYREEATFDLESFDAFISGTQTTFTLDKSTLQAGFAGYLLEWCEFNMQRSFLENTHAATADVASVIRILKDY